MYYISKVLRKFFIELTFSSSPGKSNRQNFNSYELRPLVLHLWLYYIMWQKGLCRCT